MIMMETQMAMLWDYSKEENHSMPTTNPKEAPMNPVQVSTWEQSDKGLYKSYGTKIEPVKGPFGMISTDTYDKG